VGPMSDYLRPKVPGATVFFTVTLAARGGSALVGHVGASRSGAAVSRRCVRGVARSSPRGVDVAGGGCGVFLAVGGDQGAVHEGTSGRA